MKLKPFDLEAAKAGKPIVKDSGTPVRFIGTMLDGRIVYERDGHLYHTPESTLRMAPEERTVWVVLTPAGGGHWLTTEESAEECAKLMRRVHKIEAEVRPIKQTITWEN